jgi:hypothetical protein
MVDRVPLFVTREDEVDLVLVMTVGEPLATQVGVSPRECGVVVGIRLPAMRAGGVACGVETHWPVLPSPPTKVSQWPLG